jgi:uncharacterized protein YecT (DUF1311 family)
MIVRKVLLVTLTLALLSVGGIAMAKSSSAPPCSGQALSGTFKAIPGSAGAGSISYRLTLVNRSQSSCYVTGIPMVVLLDKQGKALPTHARVATPGVALAAKIELAAGSAATADARFSPDVPGAGEQHPGPCEKTAYWLSVTPTSGQGSLRAPISPPTPVCEKGSLSFSLLKAALSSSYASCLKHAGTTRAMLACIYSEYGRVGELLDRAYRQLLATVGYKAKLATAQKRWLAFRDADCKFAGSLNAGGSLQQVDVGTCLVDQTTSRLKELQLYQRQAGPHYAALSAATASATSVNLLTTLRVQLAHVKAKTSVPVLLPATLPWAGKVPKLYPTGAATARHWLLELSGAPNCGEATACFFASFEGTRGGKLPRKANLHLAGGDPAVFQASACGASCSPATLWFTHKGVLYTWADKVLAAKDAKAVLAGLAAGAITAGPR